MKFVLVNNLGKQKIITAKSLEEAEQKANTVWKKWESIYYCDYKNAKLAHKESE